MYSVMVIMTKNKAKKPDELVTLENVKKSWVSFVIVTLFFSLIFRTSWWIIFPIVGTLIAAIEKTSAYFTMNAKCPACKSILDEGTMFCRNCGI